MINKKNFVLVLKRLGFNKDSQKNIWSKKFKGSNSILGADLDENIPKYPEELKSEGDFTKNFSQPESYVVFVCVAKLLGMGYRPEHIVLEKKWTLGHSQKSGRADITVFEKSGHEALMIIECKQSGREYQKARKDLFENKEGKQLFSYKAQARAAKWLQLYAADYDEDCNEIIDYEEIVKCHDDKNVETLAKQDNSIKLYSSASEAPDLYRVWDETYNKRTYKGLIFGKDTQAYKIGVHPLRKCDLKRFNKEDGIANGFLEILRHNSISDKENAFNKLLSLFICKLVDEKEKSELEVVDFQYKEGADDYFSLYERLLKLFHFGMDKFLKEDVFYLEDSYISQTLCQYTGKKRKNLEEELRRSFQRTKLLSCQVFAFREIYNEKLFMQNGKILVEMVELFQNYRLSYSSKEQFLGELFEQLLSHGFKQDEGQFFTPVPIARFIWNSIPFEGFVNSETLTFPKVIDYACGAGHFLTEGISALADYITPFLEDEIDKKNRIDEIVSKSFYGVEKDNRLARVSKIALLLNGANEAHIKAMDGLDHDESFLGEKNTFDILVANPPYSVDDFIVHLERKIIPNYSILNYMSLTSDDIEYVFVERICQLLKPGGIAAVVLPNWILITEDAPTMKVREIILRNFEIICISSFGGKTFGKTPTPTFVLFLRKRAEKPNLSKLIEDSVNAIFNNEDLIGWSDKNIFESYLELIGVDREEYDKFRNQDDLNELKKTIYFKQYVDSFNRDSSILSLKNSKSFIEISIEDQKRILKAKFYEKYIELEKTKVYYYALTSKQKVLLINPPKDTEMQKKYLGYTFVNRNKKEVLIESDGMLSDIHDRNNVEKLAWVVKQAFSSKEVENDNLAPYVSYTVLSELLNFSREKFYATISQVIPEKIKSAFNFIRLDDEEYFSLSIGDRVLNNELDDDGEIPVYSANVREIFGYLNKENLENYNTPSVLWGIDGDWIVNYIDAKVKFYPTDHCGYLRVNNNMVNTYYIGMVMNIIGEKNNFSRSYRASVDRVKGLEIPFPPRKIQDKVAKECKLIDTEFKTSRMALTEYRDRILKVLKKHKVIIE